MEAAIRIIYGMGAIGVAGIAGRVLPGLWPNDILASVVVGAALASFVLRFAYRALTGRSIESAK